MRPESIHFKAIFDQWSPRPLWLMSIREEPPIVSKYRGKGVNGKSLVTSAEGLAKKRSLNSDVSGITLKPKVSPTHKKKWHRMFISLSTFYDLYKSRDRRLKSGWTMLEVHSSSLYKSWLFLKAEMDNTPSNFTWNKVAATLIQGIEIPLLLL
jgi:hypothetical protein